MRLRALLAAAALLVLSGQVHAQAVYKSPGAGAVADWTLGSVRYYALDGTSGNDANSGYSDVSMTAAGTVAVRTPSKLMSMIPSSGNGRDIVIAIKGGGINYAAVLNFLGKPPGYNFFLIRATSDFSDNALDQIKAGASIALAGGNGDSSFTTAAAGSSTLTFNVGGAVTLTAETALLGKRIRFDAATATVALRNITRAIAANTSSSITVASSVLPAVPADTDTFFIEEPGAIFTQIVGQAGDIGSTTNQFARGVQIVGLASTTTTANVPAWRIRGGAQLSISFCEQRGANATGANLSYINDIQIAPTYSATTVANQTVTTGAAFRFEGGLTSTAVTVYTVSPIFITGSTAASFSDLGNIVIGGPGGYFSRVPTLGRVAPNFPSAFSQPFSPVFGSTTTTMPMRMVGTSGPLNPSSSNMAIQNITMSTFGANPTIRPTGVGLKLVIDGITGSAVTTDAGFDFSRCYYCTIELGRITANTVTGTAGDIRLQSSVIAAHTDFTTTNVIDSEGNNIVGTAGSVTGQAVLVTNKNGAALAVGDVVHSNGTTAQVVAAQGDTNPHAEVLGVMVTAPANNATGYMVTSGPVWATFDGTPSFTPSNGIAYLSTGTAKALTTTIPTAAATNQRLRAGRISKFSGTKGLVSLSPESLAVTADGNP